MRYKSGVMDGKKVCPSSGGGTNHAVLATGYVLDKDESYVVIRNSWGDKWGEKGYFKFKLYNSDLRETDYGACNMLQYGTKLNTPVFE